MLVRDTAGDLVPFGAVRRSRVEDFLTGTLPSWLAVPDGTISYGSPASTFGYAQITTAATASARATLATSFSLDLTKIEAARITAEGLHCSDSAAFIALGFFPTGNNGGSRFYDNPTAASVAQIRSMTGSGTTSTNVDIAYQAIGDGEYARHRNLSFLLLPRTKEVYVMEGDHVWGYAKHATMSLALPVEGRLVVATNADATARWARVEQLKVEVWTN